MNQPDVHPEPNLLKALKTLQHVPPRDPEAANRGRARFLAEARTLRETPPVLISPVQRLKGWISPNHRGEGNPKFRWTFSASLATLVAVLILITALGGSAISVYAAESALPGDPLYALKNVSEDARVSLSRDPGAVAELHLQYAHRRVEEIAGLIERGRYDQIKIATDAFEHHIFRAIGALASVSASNPAQSQVLSDELIRALASYTGVLTALLERVPGEGPKSAIQQAVTMTQLTVSQDEVEFTGMVTAMLGPSWTIRDIEVTITEETEIKSTIQVGDVVKVHAQATGDGTFIARQIELAAVKDEDQVGTKMELRGVVNRLSATSIVVNNQTIAISPETEIKDAVQVGDLVKVEAWLQPDGSLTADEIEVLDVEDEDNGDGDPDDDEGDGMHDDGDDLDDDDSDDPDDDSDDPDDDSDDPDDEDDDPDDDEDDDPDDDEDDDPDDDEDDDPDDDEDDDPDDDEDDDPDDDEDDDPDDDKDGDD